MQSHACHSSNVVLTKSMLNWLDMKKKIKMRKNEDIRTGA